MTSYFSGSDDDSFVFVAEQGMLLQFFIVAGKVQAIGRSQLVMLLLKVFGSA